MSRRAIHLYPWDGVTESDQDPPEQVYCGTEGSMEDDQLSGDWRYVTCKRCLNIRAKDLAARADEERGQKVRLFDEAQAITLTQGHANISTAIKCLIRERNELKAELDRVRTDRDALLEAGADLV